MAVKSVMAGGNHQILPRKCKRLPWLTKYENMAKARATEVEPRSRSLLSIVSAPRRGSSPAPARNLFQTFVPVKMSTTA